jgi:hypothetical protein
MDSICSDAYKSPPRRLGLNPRSGHVVFVVDKVALEQVFSEYFSYPCQLSFHRMLHTHHHHHPRLVTVSKSVASVLRRSKKLKKVCMRFWLTEIVGEWKNFGRYMTTHSKINMFLVS